MKNLYRAVGAIFGVCLMMLTVNAQEDNGRAYYDIGVFAYEDENYAEAEQNLKEALQIHPENPYYNHFMGKICLKTERYSEADAYLNRAWRTKPELPGLTYDRAYLYYKMADYSKAGDLFREAAQEEASNVLARYHAGICLFRQNRYQEAIDYFIAAAEQSPTISVNGRYYAGVCYQQIGNTQKAAELFEYVRNHADSQELRSSASAWIDAIRKREQAFKPWHLYLKIGWQYDSNVPLEPKHEDIYSDEGDCAVTGFFSGRFNVINRKDIQIGAGYSHYQVGYDDLNGYNLIGSIGSLYAAWEVKCLTFRISWLPAYFWLDSESYLRQHQIKPEITWKANENLTFAVCYNYSRDVYFDHSGKDGHTHEVSADGYYGWMNGAILLFGGIGYADASASHTDYNFGQWKLRVGASTRLPLEFELMLTGKYEIKSYDDTDSVFGVRRDDTRYGGSLSLSRKLYSDWLGISAEFSYIQNDSNIDEFTHERILTTLSLTAAY